MKIQISKSAEAEVIDADVDFWPWKTRGVDDVVHKACRHHIKAFGRARNMGFSGRGEISQLPELGTECLGGVTSLW